MATACGRSTRAQTSTSEDQPDRISLDIDPDMKRHVFKNQELLNRALNVKIAGYYFSLGLLLVMVGTALACMACGYENPIWPMIVTYVMGSIQVRDKAGKYIKGAMQHRGNVDANVKSKGAATS